MPRKPSDDIRDARRLLKIKGQQVNWLDHNSKGETKGWSADPTVKKTKDYKSNKDGFRVDWDEKHHVMGLNLYERFTEGMSPEQIKTVDERLAQKGLIKGNNGLNRIDLPRRLHESSKFPGIEGAHQVTKREGIDSKDELARLKGLSVDEKIGELDSFIDNQVRHRQVGQQKFMEQFQLQRGNNATTNVFGGNLSQAVLQNRDKLATAKAGAALSKERKLTKLATKSIPKGVGKALNIPLLGGAVAGGLALMEGASPMDAAAAALDAENPLDGGAVKAGTLTSQRQAEVQNPQRYNKQGPKVTTPQQSNRAALLRKDPTQERGYETLQRWGGEAVNMVGGWLKQLGIK